MRPFISDVLNQLLVLFETIYFVVLGQSQSINFQNAHT